MGRRLPGNPESKPHTHGPVKPSLIPPGFAVDGYVLVTESNQPSASLHALHVNGPDGQRVTAVQRGSGCEGARRGELTPISAAFNTSPQMSGTDGTFVVPIDKPGKWHIIIDAQPVGATAPDRVGDEHRRRGTGRRRQAPAADTTMSRSMISASSVMG